MSVSPPVAALIQLFDTATDAIASRIQRLIDKQASLSEEDKAAFQGEIDKLNSLGKDPEEPVPPTI